MAALQEVTDPDRPPLWKTYIEKKSNRSYYYNKDTNASVWKKPDPKPTFSMYDNPLVMSLREWIETPVARDLIHEASTLQLLGITNYSHWPHAAALRTCFFEDTAARGALEGLAEARLRAMAHVGLTERLEESVLSLAADLGVGMADTAWKSASRTAFTYDAPDFDQTAVVAFNYTHPGTNATVEVVESMAEARVRLSKGASRKKVVDAKIKALLPQLEELVGKEDAYLDAQEEADARWGRAIPVLRGWRGFISFITRRKVTTHSLSGVNSPWAGDIEALDDRVFDLQEESKLLAEEAAVLNAIPGIRGPSIPEGPAKLILPDEEYLDSVTVGAAYRQCSQSAAAKAGKKRKDAFFELRTPWDEGIDLSKEGRTKIDPGVIQRILDLNPVDQRLWEVGNEILEARLAAQRAAGVLETLPAAKTTSSSSGRTRASKIKKKAATQESSINIEQQPQEGEKGTVGEDDAALDEHDELR